MKEKTVIGMVKTFEEFKQSGLNEGSSDSTLTLMAFYPGISDLMIGLSNIELEVKKLRAHVGQAQEIIKFLGSYDAEIDTLMGGETRWLLSSCRIDGSSLTLSLDASPVPREYQLSQQRLVAERLRSIAQRFAHQSSISVSHRGKSTYDITIN